MVANPVDPITAAAGTIWFELREDEMVSAERFAEIIRAAYAPREQALQGLLEAAKALGNKLDEVKPAIDNAFKIAMVHGQTYSGPTYEDDYKALRASIAKAEEVTDGSKPT